MWYGEIYFIGNSYQTLGPARDVPNFAGSSPRTASVTRYQNGPWVLEARHTSDVVKFRKVGIEEEAFSGGAGQEAAPHRPTRNSASYCQR
jgi:hypothetical protein